MEFLDYLTYALGCEYLSDLHFCTITRQEADRISSLDINMFSSDDYYKAARYLLGSEKTYPNAHSARQAVIEYLLKTNQRKKQ